jgi:tripartite ATP-independent transporter DctP family solute receptor
MKKRITFHFMQREFLTPPAIKTRAAIVLATLFVYILLAGCGQQTAPSNPAGSGGSQAAAKSDAKTSVLRAATNNPKISGMYKGMEIFKEFTEERTNGRVTVELFADGVLGDEEQLAEGMQMGTVDFTVHSAAKYANFVAEMDIYSPPYAFKNWDHMKAVSASEINTKLMGLVKEKRGDYYVGVYTDGVRNIFTRNPVKTLAEMKNLKLRTMTGPNETNAWKALGTNPTPLAYTELYSALYSGVVDGAENTMTSVLGMKFYESCKYILRTGHNYMVLPVLLSGKAVARVSGDLQNVIIKAAEDSCKEQLDWAIEYDKANEDVLKKQFGVTVFEFSAEDLDEAIKLVMPVHKENAKRINMEKEYDLIAELAKKF